MDPKQLLEYCFSKKQYPSDCSMADGMAPPCHRRPMLPSLGFRRRVSDDAKHAVYDP